MATMPSSEEMTQTNEHALYDALKDLCENNCAYFKNDDSENGQRLHGAFVSFIDQIETVKPMVLEIERFAPEYDFDENTPGNGFRSFLEVVNCCLKHSIKRCKYVMQNRSSLLFRKTIYMKEIESCCHMLASLITCLKHMKTLHTKCGNGNLFPGDDFTGEMLFDSAEMINQYCFYGRCLGIQYCDSMAPILKFVATCMAGFSEAYYKEGGKLAKTTSTMWTSGKFFLNPELRARRIVNISQSSTVEFCKAFWFLAESELLHTLPSFIATTIMVNKVITIPSEPMQLNHRVTGELIDIPIPSSHLGIDSVKARLLSFNKRQGMFGEKNTTNLLPPSNALIFHCHGGGFVAQSSKSHELYLREWAAALNCPILSLDYSLAPKAPFPRAVEEAYYAYCWCLKNASLLGTTAEKIIFAGDSAGANLNLVTAIKAIETGIRCPDGLFLAYCPIRMTFEPSPARLLCIMDPLLPFGFMMRCLKAYASPSQEVLDANKKRLDEQNGVRNAGKLNGGSKRSSVNSTTVFEKQSASEFEEVSAGNSTWEKLSNNDDANAAKSPLSDEADTFASASFHSQNLENTELITPDGSNGVSFEEDSQPITIHKNFLAELEMEAANGTAVPQSASSQYVSEFLERYVLDTDLDEEGFEKPVLKSIPRTASEENIIYDASRDGLTMSNIQEKIYKFASSFSDTLSGLATPTQIQHNEELAQQRSNLDALLVRSPSMEFIFNVPKNPYLSPYWADESILKQLPPTKILTIELDPCLDDCVMFAKKLKNLGNDIGLDILKGLPHGFLNFSLLSKDAADGNKQCIKRLAELLEVNLIHEKTKSCC